jgi:hypothetical protein
MRFIYCSMGGAKINIGIKNTGIKMIDHPERKINCCIIPPIYIKGNARGR